MVTAQQLAFGLEVGFIMTKLLGTLFCTGACLLLGLGATGCTKKTTTDKKVVETTTSKNPDNSTSTTKQTKETKTEVSKTEPDNTKRWMFKAPANTTIKQGDTAKVAINVTRDHYTDPVDLKVTGLPDGVTVEGTPSIAKDATTTDLMLKASADAKVVDDQTVTVWAGSGAMKQESTFKLSVKKK